jgi:hypothetical protein
MTYEVHTDCANVGFGVGVIGETKEQARLSHTGISDEEELEEIVVSVVAWDQLVLSLENLGELLRIVVMLQAGNKRLSGRHGD